MPHFLPVEDWLRGLAATAGQIVLCLAVLRLAYLFIRYTSNERHP